MSWLLKHELVDKIVLDDIEGIICMYFEESLFPLRAKVVWGRSHIT